MRSGGLTRFGDVEDIHYCDLRALFCWCETYTDDLWGVRCHGKNDSAEGLRNEGLQTRQGMGGSRIEEIVVRVIEQE